MTTFDPEAFCAWLEQQERTCDQASKSDAELGDYANALRMRHYASAFSIAARQLRMRLTNPMAYSMVQCRPNPPP